MPAFAWSLCFTFALLLAAIVVARRLYGIPRFEVRIQDPEEEPKTDADEATSPVPVPPPSPPKWLSELEALGFNTFETADISLASAAPHAEYAICVGTPHPYNTCGSCNARAIRILGETPMASGKGKARIIWVGWVCGRCGSVDLTSPNAPRFLNMMLADSRSMLTFVAHAKRHEGKPFSAMVAGMLMQNEGVLQARINHSAELRAGLPVEKKAKVLLFEKGRRPKKRRKGLF
jgi:hypothetical protein